MYLVCRAATHYRGGRFESAGSSAAEMQHSPSRATDPEGLRVDRDLELRERLREDIRGHIFSGTVLDVDSLVVDGLADEMKSYVDVLRASVVVVVR
jgi:hypothetical protein